mmetsp:Transcript_41581/g.101513  ORF Transcript_41581/g.101513 Transcript_41581/m.101513 type:complete len:354 (-) Transcript_41581:658-1719(-)
MVLPLVPVALPVARVDLRTRLCAVPGPHDARRVELHLRDGPHAPLDQPAVCRLGAGKDTNTLERVDPKPGPEEPAGVGKDTLRLAYAHADGRAPRDDVRHDHHNLLRGAPQHEGTQRGGQPVGLGLLVGRVLHASPVEKRQDPPRCRPVGGLHPLRDVGHGPLARPRRAHKVVVEGVAEEGLRQLEEEPSQEVRGARNPVLSEVKLRQRGTVVDCLPHVVEALLVLARQMAAEELRRQPPVLLVVLLHDGEDAVDNLWANLCLLVAALPTGDQFKRDPKRSLRLDQQPGVARPGGRGDVCRRVVELLPRAREERVDRGPDALVLNEHHVARRRLGRRNRRRKQAPQRRQGCRR